MGTRVRGLDWIGRRGLRNSNRSGDENETRTRWQLRLCLPRERSAVAPLGDHRSCILGRPLRRNRVCCCQGLAMAGASLAASVPLNQVFQKSSMDLNQLQTLQSRRSTHHGSY
ncbi:uncharacterized protein LOC125548479 [Triticum urartu]|uniref:uncharacterized protein LOC125548479 n=1 Tax=Triticum urartu TaxID=4572 RepID=UPI002042F2C3|nr:uncharacterized protein LOC125548479 [Triticum urartu]